MDPKVTALERAFQLAKSGKVGGIPEIRQALNREGYSGDQLEGSTLRRQLTSLLKTAREKSSLIN
jgi:hypothetical protein